MRELISSGRARQLREAHRLSRAEVAGVVGVTSVTLARWEENAHSPTGVGAERYAKVLDKLARDGRA